MINNLFDNFINSLVNNTKNLNQYIKDNKSKILIIFLLIVKKIYVHIIIFDIICTLYTTIVLLYITNDIDKSNDIIANPLIKKYSLLTSIIYFISNDSIINQTTNLGSSITPFNISTAD